MAGLPRASGLIAFISDFGLSDPYVGIVHGVVERLAPGVRVIDVSHGVRAFNIVDGAYVLYTSYRWFPRGTVFLVVVDPGVGGERKPVALATRNYFFVGPDNGVLYPAAAEDGVLEARVLDNPAFHMKPVSMSFHGRDVFAPAAAALAQGVGIEALGSRIDASALTRLQLRGPCGPGDRVEALVVHVDRFGNAALGLEPGCRDRLCSSWGGAVRVQGPRGSIEAKCLPVFSHAELGEAVFYVNSLGFPEVAVNLGSAADALGVEPGDRVVLEKP